MPKLGYPLKHPGDSARPRCPFKQLSKSIRGNVRSLATIEDCTVLLSKKKGEKKMSGHGVFVHTHTAAAQSPRR